MQRPSGDEVATEGLLSRCVKHDVAIDELHCVSRRTAQQNGAETAVVAGGDQIGASSGGSRRGVEARLGSDADCGVLVGTRCDGERKIGFEITVEDERRVTRGDQGDAAAGGRAA